jgi:hypothetical protein
LVVVERGVDVLIRFLLGVMGIVLRWRRRRRRSAHGRAMVNGC